MNEKWYTEVVGLQLTVMRNKCYIVISEISYNLQ